MPKAAKQGEKWEPNFSKRAAKVGTALVNKFGDKVTAEVLATILEATESQTLNHHVQRIQLAIAIAKARKGA